MLLAMNGLFITPCVYSSHRVFLHSANIEMSDITVVALQLSRNRWCATVAEHKTLELQ